MQPNTLLATLQQHLPKNRHQYQHHPEVLPNKLSALQTLTNNLRVFRDSDFKDEIGAAAGCIMRIMECSTARDCDRGDACQRYIEILKLRPQHVSADSLRHMLDAMGRKSTHGDHARWHALETDLHETLKGFGIDIEAQPMPLAKATSAKCGSVLDFLTRAVGSTLNELAT